MPHGDKIENSETVALVVKHGTAYLPERLALPKAVAQGSAARGQPGPGAH